MPRQSKPRRNEHAAQARLFELAGLASGQYPVLRTMHAIPNAGKRSRYMGAHMREEGLKKGYPDVELPTWAQDRSTCGLIIEFKAEGEKNDNPDQLEMQEALRQAGNRVELAHTGEEAWGFVAAHLGIPPGFFYGLEGI